MAVHPVGNKIPPRKRKYWYKYHQTTFTWPMKWFATFGQGTSQFRGGVFARNEKVMRNKLARRIRKHRKEDEIRERTTRHG